MVMRFDRVPFKATRTDEGYIKDTPVLTRSGVFVYVDSQGRERREYRPPEEVFNADSLASLKGVPVTDVHPGEVTATNVKQHMIGTVLSEGRKDGDQDMVGDIVIYDTGPVDDGGKKELSCGYKLQLDETPGVSPAGERYDAVQRNIRYNHLAVVKRGRAGNARLNLDAADAVTKTEEDNDMSMVKIRLDSGLSYDAAPEVANELERLRADAAELRKKVDAESARADTEKSRADKAEGDIKKAREDAQASALARVKLEAVATAHKVDFKADTADRALREGVIKAIRGDGFDLTGKSDGYVEAAFDLAVADKAGRQDAAAAQRQAATGQPGKPTPDMNQDSGDKPKSAAQARAAMIAARNKE
ncbi:DUF2213 domain-containing protein [Bordetella petrii]|uniref:DUF2213 domain-containing protein n=1 Tax=Bordetella petrii (strain ATCC BAA-461 / DSM 12804 / CCUG 43448 / CIP 107267 / Se-1111R) TaxID=340100 RepID=A9I900_BORPD|nr:DUF2213 domain-containing protein [Bordetella petrii]CAP41311.1 conserved hypothetical protein [Bordetella petrii]